MTTMQHPKRSDTRRWLLLWLLCCALPAAAGDSDQACTDPCLKAAIAALYLHSPFLSSLHIDIAVSDSVATLQGSAPSAGVRALAEETAAGVDGITAVDNRIRVAAAGSGAPAARAPVDCLTGDAALASRVRSQLYWNRTTHGVPIQVTARDGVITLRGQAADRHQAELVRLIALNTCGVRRVENRLQTGGNPKPQEPAIR